MGLREVSAVLWRERHLLELLLFKLDEEQLVLAAGHTRWLPRATREMEMVVEEIRETELERAVEVSRVTNDLRLPAEAGLRQLADATQPPWQGILLEHRQAFLTLTDEITALNALASVGPRYHPIEVMMVDLQLQEVAYQAALGATARALQPNLMDFLR
jgi:hypothetical protein